jgi:hypothetical protein
MAKSIDGVSRDAIHALLTQVAARLAISPFISYRATSREFFRTYPIDYHSWERGLNENTNGLIR